VIDLSVVASKIITNAALQFLVVHRSEHGCSVSLECSGVDLTPEEADAIEAMVGIARDEAARLTLLSMDPPPGHILGEADGN
jgi:hypothetical protein